MDSKKTIARILGSGIYNLDTNVVREYPDGPGSRRFTETVLGDEVGGTCGNVMCILAGLGLETYPQACLDDSPEGLRITEDLKRFGCDTRFVTNTPEGGTSLLRVTRKRFLDGEWKTLPPVVNAHVVDTEGAGDATTSAIIYGIACSGKRFRDLDETELVRILTDAQRFASRSVSRMGTKATAVKD